jgi:hypothetical protein
MATVPTLVYTVALLTSLVCAFLLVRSYRRSRTRLLLWTAGCFALLALNNFLVVLDLLVLRDINLVLLRHLASLAAVCVLLFGFIWEVDD